MIRKPSSRRRGRNVARACAALSATMLATTGWLSTGDAVETANAEPTAGSSFVVVPNDGRVGGGDQLDAGTEDTEFTLRLPEGAACPGDGGDGWRVTSYVVPATVDPATLSFNTTQGPVPSAFGNPQSAFRQPLSDTTGEPYIVAQPANKDPNAADPNAGNIINVPAFSFGVYGPGDVPAGEYNIGIACVMASGTSFPIDRYWNVEMTVTQSPETPSVMSWTVTQDVITQTALTLGPVEGAKAGDPVTLTAAVTPADVAGTVTFLDAGTAIGEPTAIAAGSATITEGDLPAGTRDFTATFTPSAEGYVGSTSPPVTYTITAEATTTALEVSPADGAAVGDTVTLTATVAPAEATGTVTFLNGTTTLGEGTVESGTASLDLTDLAAGEHVLAARFAPAAGSPYAESTSAEVAYTIAGDPAVAVTLAVDPADEATVGEEVELTADISADAGVIAGDVEFRSGSDSLGTVEAEAGTAALVVDDLDVGDHSLTAMFVPDAEADLQPATSPPLPYRIVAAATTTTTTTVGPAPTTEPPPVLSDGVFGGGSVATGSGTLPVTGGSLSLAFWAVALITSGRVAVLLGRTPRIQAVASDGA